MSRRPPPAIEGMHSLKVDNISYNTTQADLRRLFDKYGDIGDIHIPRDKYSRQSRGFAFVRFYSRRDCEYAQERTDGRWMDGRELRVSVARYERVIDDRGGRNRSRSRSPRRRSRTRSPRYSRSRSRDNRRSRSPRRDRSKSRERSASRSRSPSHHSKDKSASPGRSRSPTPKSNRSRSPSRENSRSPSPRD